MGSRIHGVFPYIAIALLRTTAWAQSTPAEMVKEPRYFAAMRGELEALQIPHRCNLETVIRARCSFTHHGETSKRTFDVHLVYSDNTDTVYFYVERYVITPPHASSTNELLRRLMELNWELLVGKLEWDGHSGEIRLSMVLNTDSNFDRHAFRSMVRTIGPLADRYAAELSRLAE